MSDATPSHLPNWGNLNSGFDCATEFRRVFLFSFCFLRFYFSFSYFFIFFFFCWFYRQSPVKFVCVDRRTTSLWIWSWSVQVWPIIARGRISIARLFAHLISYFVLFEIWNYSISLISSWLDSTWFAVIWAMTSMSTKMPDWNVSRVRLDCLAVFDIYLNTHTFICEVDPTIVFVSLNNSIDKFSPPSWCEAIFDLIFWRV